MSRARLVVYIFAGVLIIGTLLSLMVMAHTGVISIPAHGG